MGWCYEFGAQICQGCSAPMVASASSCKCDQCGTVCTGRFPSCRDVWARGPQPFTVVSAPAITGQASHTPAATNGTAAAAVAPPAYAPPTHAPPAYERPAEPPLATRVPAGVDRRLADLENRLTSLEAVSAYVQTLRRALRKELERVGTEAAECDRLIGETGERVGTLEGRVTTLATIPARVDSLSREVFEIRRTTSARVDQHEVGALQAQLEGLTSLRARVTAMEEIGGRTPAMASLEQRVATLERSSARDSEPSSPDAPPASS